MKKITIFAALLIAFNVNAQKQKGQDPCTEDFAAVNIGYAFPNSIVGGVDYFTGWGLVGGAGSAYTFPSTFEVKQGDNSYTMQSNSFDLYAYFGWRLLRVDYVVSVFGNVGYTMGNVDNLQPFTSIKVLFPIGYKAVSIEPVYIVGRGMTAKCSFHLKF